MKRFTVLLFSAIMAFSGLSQEDGDYKKFKFGFKVDPNLSWMTPKSDDLISDGLLLRGGFGLNADIMFSENYAFGTGFSINGNGGVLSYLDDEARDNDSTEYIVLRKRKYKLKYVEIPLTIKLRTSEIGYITYWGQFGLGLGFTTNVRGEDDLKFISERKAGDPNWESSEKADLTDENLDISDDIVPVRASLIIAAGIDYSLSGSTSLMFGLTYNNGLTDVLRGKGIQQDDNGQPVFEEGQPKGLDLKSFSNHFMLTAGILF